MKRWQVVVQSGAWVVGLALILFSAAGRLDLPPVWEYLGLFGGFSLAGAFLVDPELAQERRRPGGKPLDRRYSLLLLLFVAHLVVAGLDVGRYHWTAPLPRAAQVGGVVVFGTALGIATWAMVVNRFLSSVVRIQTERGHQLVTDGPYRWVRHPTYAAAVLLLPAGALALGSWVAVPLTLPLLVFLFYRTVTEDTFLKKNLPGYEEYAARVRHRLLPGVW